MVEREIYEVDNTGRRPVDPTQLRAAIDDNHGRRFQQRPATAGDTRGVLQPGRITTQGSPVLLALAPGAHEATTPGPASSANRSPAACGRRCW